MNVYEFNGTVLPSSLVSDSGTRSNPLDFPTLYVGRVRSVHYPDQDTNANKKYIEYDVAIEYENRGSGIRSTTLIYRCRVASMFGGVADFETWTPRPAAKDPMALNPKDKSPSQKLEAGSQVLVLCLSGNARYGIIVGGLPHTEATKDPEGLRSMPETADAGHYWIRRFNGVTMHVDDAGQFLLSFRGATDADDQLRDSADANASGSQMALTKDGSIRFQTKDGQQSIHLDHTNNKISVRANTALEVTGLDADGETPKFQLTMNNGELTVRLQDGATLAVVGKDGDTKMTVGDGTRHVAIVEALEVLYNQLKAKLDLFDAHIHPSAMGPTGPPAPTIMAPAWDPAIKSNKVSIPNG